MRRLLGVILVLMLGGCGIQTQNSSSLDALIYGSVSGTPEFAAAQIVFVYNCIPCHAYSGMTAAQLEAEGLVTAGSPETSPIYYRMANSFGGPGPKNMPPSGAVSNEDLETVRTWITGM